MTKLSAIAGYSAAKPVTPVASTRNEKTAVKAEAGAPQSSRGPAVRVTLSADAIKALAGSQASETARVSPAPIKPVTRPVVPTPVKKPAKAA